MADLLSLCAKAADGLNTIMFSTTRDLTMNGLTKTVTLRFLVYFCQPILSVIKIDGNIVFPKLTCLFTFSGWAAPFKNCVLFLERL